MKLQWRRVRATVGNAVTWAAGWVVGGLTLVAATYPSWGLSRLLDLSEFLIEFGPWLASTFAVTGFLSGAAFSTYLSIAGRDSLLGDLRPLRFALGGAVLSALVTPLVASGLFLALGEALAMADVLLIAGTSGALGAATAFTTIKIAQAASAVGPEPVGGIDAPTEHLLVSSD